MVSEISGTGGVETSENREDGREKYGIVVGLEIGGYTV